MVMHYLPDRPPGRATLTLLFAAAVKTKVEVDWLQPERQRMLSRLITNYC